MKTDFQHPFTSVNLQYLTGVFLQNQIGVDTVVVYMYLKNRANKDDSCGTIAKDLGYSKRTVYRALDDLEQKGFIRRTARWRDKGGRSSSLYILG